MADSTSKEKHQFKEIIKNFFSPLLIIKNEPIFIFWLIATLILAPLGSWIIWINESFENVLKSFSNTLTLTLALSLITPIILDFIFETKVMPKLGKKVKFSDHKTYSIAFSIVTIIILFCFLGIRTKTNNICNIVLAIISIPFSFYLYCISKMSLFKNLDGYDTKPYDYEAKERRKKVKAEADALKNIGEAKV